MAAASCARQVCGMCVYKVLTGMTVSIDINSQFTGNVGGACLS